jgi:hypothetical protein
MSGQGVISEAGCAVLQVEDIRLDEIQAPKAGPEAAAQGAWFLVATGPAADPARMAGVT